MVRSSLKISRTFIDFVQHLLSIVDQNTTEDQIKEAFQIAYTVWNGIIMDSESQNDHYIKWLRQLASKRPELIELLDQLILRKKTLFAEDHRLIGNYKVTYKNGDLHVWAEARSAKKTRKK